MKLKDMFPDANWNGENVVPIRPLTVADIRAAKAAMEAAQQRAIIKSQAMYRRISRVHKPHRMISLMIRLGMQW